MRAKIIDGVFTPAPRKIQREIDGEPYTTYNPTDKMLAEQGWLPVIEEPMPDNAMEGYHYEPSYSEYMTDNGNVIYQEWKLVEDPEPDDEISAEEALAIILGGVI